MCYSAAATDAVAPGRRWDVTDKPSLRIPSERWGPHYRVLWWIACSPSFAELFHRWPQFGKARSGFLRLTWNLRQRPWTKDGQMRSQFRGDEGYLLQELICDLEQRVIGNPVFDEPRAQLYRDATLIDVCLQATNRKDWWETPLDGTEQKL
jgi:hypothetical protein